MDLEALEREDALYRELRPAVFGVAYRMVGSVSEAEDLVQEAFLRLHRAVASGEGERIESPKAYLITVVTRLAVDHLRSARRRRERYVRPWLPEPLPTEMEPDVAQTAELAESLTLAFLVVPERLSPLERAAFLLHDVFVDYPFAEVGEDPGAVGGGVPAARRAGAAASDGGGPPAVRGPAGGARGVDHPVPGGVGERGRSGPGGSTGPGRGDDTN